MTVVTMKRYFYILLTLVVLASCNAHEWPHGPEPEMDVSVDLVFDFTEIALFKEIILTRAEDDDAGQSAAVRSDMEMRYILRCYKAEGGSDYSRMPDAEFVFLNTDLEDPEFRCQVKLTPGHYRVKVWADYVKYGSTADLYYDTTDFRDISIAASKEDYAGSDDMRDAFVGEQEVTVGSIPASMTGQPQESTRIMMQRPFAKFKFVTTDFVDFVQKYLGLTDPEEIAQADLSGYRVLFRYTGYLPTHYNLLTEKPFDAATGYEFFSTLSEPTATEATLGFDYVFVNGTESSVSVALGIYDRDGNLLSFSQPIEVPLMRNRLTIVSDKFLSQSATSSITIDTEYDGNYDIYYNE